jgi:long-chain acyl-CoA synthetase
MMNLAAAELGAVVHFVENPREIVTCAAEVRPRILCGVPRFFEKVVSEIELRSAATPRVVRRSIHRILHSDHADARAAGVRARVLDAVVRRQLRKVLGGRLQYLVTGGAPLNALVIRKLNRLGWEVLEAYGTSENAVPMCANRAGSSRVGSVGRPLAPNDIKLAADGEVLVRGAGVSHGYWPSGEVVAADGYYHTGDLGRFDDDGYLYLVGRKTDMIKTSTGRKISPSQVEAAYLDSPYLNHVVVFGNGRKHLAALCTLAAPQVLQRLAADGVRIAGDAGEAELAVHEAVQSLIQNEFDRLGAALTPHERVARFTILPRQLSVELGEMTGALKLRRRRVEELHRDRLDELFPSADERSVAAAWA